MVLPNFSPNPENTIKRAPQRGHYDWETIRSVLGKSFLCHLGLVSSAKPIVIPTLYGFDGDHIYIHGSAASRLMNHIDHPVCFTVTVVHGLVLARSAFHHSANYESVVLFGKMLRVEGEEKMHALKVISDQCLKGRWEEVRLPNTQEMKATYVAKLEVETGSAKIREGAPIDDKEDYSLDIWAGELPIQPQFGVPIPDPALNSKIGLSPSIQQVISRID